MRREEAEVTPALHGQSASLQASAEAELQRLHGQLEVEVLKRTRALRTLIEASLDPLVTISPEGKITDVNRATEEITGVPRNELIGTDFSEYFTEPVRAREGYQLVFSQGRVVDYPLTIRHRSGAEADVLYNASVYRDEAGEIAGVFAAARDVTETKKAHLQVARLAAIVTTSQDAIFTKSRDDVVTSWNPAAEELYGYSAAEMIGADVGVLMAPGHEDEAALLTERVFAGERIAGFESVRRRKDGTLVEMSLSLSPIFDEDGMIVAVSVIGHDISKRKQAERERHQFAEALRSAGAYHRSLIEASLDPLVTISPEGKITDVNRATEEITGVQRSELIGTDFSEYFTDPVRAREGYQLVFSQGRVVDYPLTIRHRSGAEAHVLYNASVYRDEAGEIAGVFAAARDVTEREDAQAELLRVNEELRRSSTLLNEAQGIAHIGSWELDIVDNVLTWSDEIFRMFEIDPTQFAASYEAFLDAIHPDDRAAVNAAYTRSLETKSPYAISHRLLFPDGRIKFVHEECETFYDEAGQPIRSVGTVQDVTERRLAEKALRDSQRKLAFHLEQTLLGVIEWDTDFRVRTWNPAAEAIFGFNRAEAVGRHASELIMPKTLQPQLEATWEALLRQEGGQFMTNENVTKDGATIVCEWVNTPLTDEDGAVVGVMSLARDITERRQAEELRVAKEAAEAASGAKSAFLANMSHEIRTPMNAILGFSQLMRRDHGLSPRQRRQLDIIASSGEHLLALVNDVLEMSRIEAGRVSANPTVFNLHVLLDEMGSLFGQRAQAKGLELRIVHGDEVPRLVVTDENKLRQILVNLLGNAVKFTEEGRIELNVTVESRAEAGLHLVAEVKDTGRGIAPEDQDRLFENFEQAAAGGDVSTGTGLGLAISREFVHLLDGEITLSSEPGVGSVFRFDIAIKEAEADALASHVQERHVAGLCPGEPHYRILVADDAPDNRELLVELLEPVGFDVKAVCDGKEALDAFVEWRPHLILMDMRMPVMDGYEATRRIRSMPGGSDVAIVGVTASAFAEMRQGVFDAGVDEFIVKPFRESELFDKVGILLDLHYVYEAEAESMGSEVTEGLDAALLADLPAEFISRLSRATIAADFDAVLGLAEEIGQHNEECAAILRVLAERFDAERILAALPGGGSSCQTSQAQ